MKYLVDPSTKTLKLVLPGDILSTEIETLRPAIFGILESTPAENWEVLVFDLSATTMVDSAGLNLLISVIRSVQPRGVKLRAIITNNNIFRTFKFTRLDRHIEMVEA